MIKKILIILFLTSNVFAQVDCEKQKREFGDGKHLVGITSACVQEVKNRFIDSSQILQTFDSRKIYFDTGIIIFEKQINEEKKFDFIVGEMTELDQIRFIFPINKHKEIVVVDQQNNISIYSTYITGNVAPLRKIKSVDSKILDIQFNEEQDEILVLTSNYLYTFELNSNSDGFKKKDKFKKRLDGQFQHLNFLKENESIFIVNQKGLKLYQYTSKEGLIAL